MVPCQYYTRDQLEGLAHKLLFYYSVARGDKYPQPSQGSVYILTPLPADIRFPEVIQTALPGRVIGTDAHIP